MREDGEKGRRAALMGEGPWAYILSLELTEKHTLLLGVSEKTHRNLHRSRFMILLWCHEQHENFRTLFFIVRKSVDSTIIPVVFKFSVI